MELIESPEVEMEVVEAHRLKTYLLQALQLTESPEVGIEEVVQAHRLKIHQLQALQPAQSAKMGRERGLRNAKAQSDTNGWVPVYDSPKKYLEGYLNTNTAA
jgi:hypothetical protein